MNPFQITMVVLAGLLGLSVFVGPAWATVKSLFSRSDKAKASQVTAPTLVDIVKEFEDLKNVCKKAQLNKALAELDKIFPLFVNGGGKNV